VHLAAPGGGTTVSHPRTVVHAAGDSRLSVIETYTGLAGHSVTNASTTVVVAAAAAVTYQRVQAEAPGAIHLGRTVIGQSAGSEVRAVSVMTGAAVARFAADVTLGGAAARLALDGLYLPRGRQRHDHVISVDHAASQCRSTQRFKGVVDDHAYGSFVGRIIVRPGTVASDASQSNHSLLLRPTAQADTRPWLEIFADEVRCTHGATVGRLDEDALFYLRSRGVSLAEARAMLVAAFVDEITSGMSPATLRDRVIAETRPAGARP
jgi:Fe-S cluster assembly protein SufD